MENRRQLLAVIAASAVCALSGCGGDPDNSANNDPHPGGSQQTSLAETTVAVAGHGKVFDKDFKEVQFSDGLLASIQDSIIDEVTKGTPTPSTEFATALQDGHQIIATQQLSLTESLLFKSALIKKLLKGAPVELTARFAWRNDTIVTYWLKPSVRDSIRQLRPFIFEKINLWGYFEPIPSTEYIDQCRARGVPIPPDWSNPSTSWVFHGTLGTNMLNPGDEANVWTYEDPLIRGACIALPRKELPSGKTDLAGIICQSALNGAACFWDSLTKSDPADLIPWTEGSLRLRDMKSGDDDTLPPCTGCHKGNNAFIIGPDDETWAKVIKDWVPEIGTFTTRLEAAIPRYIPLGWQRSGEGFLNRPPEPSVFQCAGACHEVHGGVPQPSPMPPRCAGDSLNPNACYR